MIRRVVAGPHESLLTRLPKGLNALGIVSAVAGLITLVPGLSDVGMIFGLGSIAWFAWARIVLLRRPSVTPVS